jgi:steroid delta-isomerase-like uncharacterized protein
MSGLFDKVKQAAESLTDEVKERVGGASEQAEQNKVAARRMFDVLNSHDLAPMDELLTDDVVYHELPPGLPSGRAGYKAFSQMFLDAFPDLQLTIEDQIAEGDRVVSRVTGRGTHRGELLGIAPTGRRIEASGITIMRFEGGRVAEEWEQLDMLGMMQQLGVMPTPGPPAA